MKLVVIFFTLLPCVTFADYKVSGATITKVRLSNVNAPGTVFVATEGGTVTEAKNECATTSWAFTHKVTDDPISKAQFSMILAAKASGTKISFSASGDCQVGYGVETLFTIDIE